MYVLIVYDVLLLVFGHQKASKRLFWSIFAQRFQRLKTNDIWLHDMNNNAWEHICSNASWLQCIGGACECYA
jgi:hypothetical protein